MPKRKRKVNKDVRDASALDNAVEGSQLRRNRRGLERLQDTASRVADRLDNRGYKKDMKRIKKAKRKTAQRRLSAAKAKTAKRSVPTGKKPKRARRRV